MTKNRKILLGLAVLWPLMHLLWRRLT